MRDLLLLLVILSTIPIIVRHPFAGILAWAWFTLMTPHQLAYGVFGVPLNIVIASITIAAYAVTGQFKKFRGDPITVLAILFACWILVSQVFSLDAEGSAPYVDRFIKTMVFAILCMQLADTKLKVNALMWMLVLSIGFFAAKGALFTLATLGQFRVQGLPQTVLEDNNHMGIAMATILPLILYLRSQAVRPWVRAGLLTLFGLTIIAILGTHSRGAFIGMVAFGGLYWLRSKHKFTIAAGLTLLLIPAIAFMPSKWTERMTTITEATQDESFMGRVDAWVINWKFAVENPVTGAGLRNPYNEKLAMRIDPKRAPDAKAAHSIYFEVLGGTGFVGLIIYLSMLAAGFFTAFNLSRNRRGHEPPPWIKSLGYYMQISLAVFGVAGASASMEMWDGYLLMIALVAAASRLAPRQARNRAVALKGIEAANRKFPRDQGAIAARRN